MTREDIRMAREAGFRFSDEEGPLMADHAEWQRQLFERFAALVRADEREACAKVCEEAAKQFGIQDKCAAAIRARGQA
jgi:hypothetical protein